MKKFVNAENITALVVVVIGVLIASAVAAPINAWIAKLRNKVA